MSEVRLRPSAAVEYGLVRPLWPNAVSHTEICSDLCRYSRANQADVQYWSAVGCQLKSALVCLLPFSKVYRLCCLVINGLGNFILEVQRALSQRGNTSRSFPFRSEGSQTCTSLFVMLHVHSLTTRIIRVVRTGSRKV